MPPAQGVSGEGVTKPVAMPPQYGTRPGDLNVQDKVLMPNGLPALQPAGVNVDTLFQGEISDTNKRFERIENAVLDMKREFESFKPAITRLVAVESDIQDLIQQLDILLQGEPAPASYVPPPTDVAPPIPLQNAVDEAALDISETDTEATPSTPEVVPISPPKAEPSNAASYTTPPEGGPTVSALRIGAHSDKIRLVMDVNQATAYTADLDNQEHLLVIELPNAIWSAAKEKSFGTSALLKLYKVEPMNDNKGSRVVFSLNKDTQILDKMALPPKENPYHRIVLDLKN